MNNYFSKNLKYLREQNNLSQNKLAEKIGVNQTTIARWEDENRIPTVDNAYDIAKIFDVPLSDFLSKDLRNANDNKDKSQFPIYLTKKIEFLMKKNNVLSLEDFASKSNISIINLSKLFKNEMDIITLTIIADFFDYPIDYFLEDEIKIDCSPFLLMSGKKWREIGYDLNNQEKIYEHLSKNEIDYFDLDYEISISSDEEYEFGLEDYSNMIEFYNILVSENQIQKGKLLTNAELTKVMDFIRNNKQKIKNTLESKKIAYANKQKSFMKTPLYKKYVEQLEKNSNN